MLNIVLFGPPGAGKGTQSEKIKVKYDLIHISTGDLFRKHLSKGTKLGKLAQKYMDEGKLVPDQLVIDMVDKKIETYNSLVGIIFDGFPRTVTQANVLDKLLNKYNTSISGMIMLEISEEELKKRLIERGKILKRSDDQNEKKISTRIKVYYKETLPVVNYYRKQNKLHTVKGVGKIEEIFQQITEVIDQF